jgi:hypothetical protein
VIQFDGERDVVGPCRDVKPELMFFKHKIKTRTDGLALSIVNTKVRAPVTFMPSWSSFLAVFFDTDLAGHLKMLHLDFQDLSALNN